MNVATHIREMRKDIAALRRRVSTLIMTGTVEANQGAKSKVRFDDEGADGKPFSSPFLHQASHAGKDGQGVSDFTKLGTGAPVYVLSPGGEIGAHSRIMPAGPVDERPAVGTSEQDGKVFRVGNSAIEVKDGEMKLTVGGSSITLTPGLITLKAAAIKLEQG
jgi:hypothetical protein